MRRSAVSGMGGKRRSSLRCESGMAALEVQLDAAPVPNSRQYFPHSAVPSYAVPARGLAALSLQGGRDTSYLGMRSARFEGGLARYWHEWTSHRMRASLGGDRQVRKTREREPVRLSWPSSIHLETGPGGVRGEVGGCEVDVARANHSPPARWTGTRRGPPSLVTPCVWGGRLSRTGQGASAAGRVELPRDEDRGFVWDGEILVQVQQIGLGGRGRAEGCLDEGRGPVDASRVLVGVGGMEVMQAASFGGVGITTRLQLHNSQVH